MGSFLCAHALEDAASDRPIMSVVIGKPERLWEGKSRFEPGVRNTLHRVWKERAFYSSLQSLIGSGEAECQDFGGGVAFPIAQERQNISLCKQKSTPMQLLSSLSAVSQVQTQLLTTS